MAGLRDFGATNPAEEAGSAEVSRSRAIQGWEVFDYRHLFLWKLLGGSEGKRKCKQPEC